MADEGGKAKIRVVRCPKCEKLLPELPNFSVYLCGGCGATLQGNPTRKETLVSEAEASPEKSDGENVKYLEVLENGSEKKGVISEANKGTNPEVDRVEHRREERSLPDIAAISLNNSVPESEDVAVLKQPSSSKLDDLFRENCIERREAKYRRVSKAPISNASNNFNDLGKMNAGEEKGETRSPIDVQNRTNEDIRHFSNPDEGPSDFHLNSRYKHAVGEHDDKRNMDGPTRVGHLEQDRAELLRMLDELRDQVQRSCEVRDKPNASVPANGVTTPSSSHSPRDRVNWLPQGSSFLNRNTSQRSPTPFNGHSASLPNFYPSMPAQHEIPGYGELFTHGRAVPLHPPTHAQRQLNNYFYGHLDPDPLVSYHHEGFYHQPACSCLYCYHREFSMPVQSASTVFNHRRAPCLMNNHQMYPMNGPSIFGPQGYIPKKTNATFPQDHQRTMFSKTMGRTCQPIANAAPFTICYNCSELLQLPEKSSLLENNQFKMRCGSCSHAILVKLDGSRLDISAPAAISHSSTGKNDNSNGSMDNDVLSMDEKLLPPYNFSSSNHELLEKEQQLNLSDTEKMQGLSSSSSMSRHAESLDSANSQKDVYRSSEIPPESEVISRIPSLPLREHFGYSLSDQLTIGSGKGSRSNRSEQEKIVLTENFKQNSVRDVPVATEMDFSSDEYPDPGLSQDSFEMDEDQPRTTKGGDSFLSNLIKKSFKDFPRFNHSNGNGRPRIFVNGYSIPDRVAKKAEKQAGPIYPGEYWYDYRAGFWGVMGHHCLGIIPPFIDELNYPMPMNCSGGNTGVLVNGRELHQKDLDLLVGRGLPDTPGQSYRIEISGKVWDEVSGEELDSLGKLAPTVERMKHGFGMRVPRVIA
ncbi:uncharacterized protein [Typha angustifolia]|uniref:uncharacterized protein n=1 Tax=Typha angustifolia TaxID=59011 RepID=UPI003C2D26A1